MWFAMRDWAVYSVVIVAMAAGEVQKMPRLAPYGSAEHAHNAAKVGSGKGKTPERLAARMPSPEIAAKVGQGGGIDRARTHRVVRRNARG